MIIIRFWFDSLNLVSEHLQGVIKNMGELIHETTHTHTQAQTHAVKCSKTQSDNSVSYSNNNLEQFWIATHFFFFFFSPMQATHLFDRN